MSPQPKKPVDSKRTAREKAAEARPAHWLPNAVATAPFG